MVQSMGIHLVIELVNLAVVALLRALLWMHSASVVWQTRLSGRVSASIRISKRMLCRRWYFRLVLR